MALIVETGAGLSNSESYASVDYFLSYHAARGNVSAAEMTTAEIEASLRKATDYMTQKYRNSWSGYRRFITQALDWPRIEIVIDTYHYLDYSIVPVEVQNACCELALKSFTANLLPDTTQTKISTTVGPISVTYDKNSRQGTRYKSIDSILQPYLSDCVTGVNTRLVRA